MASKNEAGFSLVEIVIAMAILVIAGTMVSRFFVKHSKAAQEIEGKNLGRSELASLLQKIRRDLQTRDSKVPLTVQSGTLQFAVPVSSTAKTDYTLTLANVCRPLPAGETLDLSRAGQGLACLQKVQCTQGMPAIEWRYSGHPSLTNSQQPDLKVFEREWKKAFGSPGLALCFTLNPDSLLIEGVLVQQKKDGPSRYLQTGIETLVIPISKRNNIELVP